MISVEFKSIGPGTCMWCKKEKDDVMNVAFSDSSFSGPMCRGDFMKALTMKVPVQKPAVRPVVAAPVPANGPVVAAK